MSSLKAIEKKVFEDMFGMASGYVLDFSNKTFAEFFRETVNIDICAPKYAFNGDSKAKRLRAEICLQVLKAAIADLSGGGGDERLVWTQWTE